MINKILMGIIKLIIGLVQLLLLPIDLLIATFMPELSGFTAKITAYFNVIGNGLSWAISNFMLSDYALGLIVLYYGIILTLPLLVYAFKLGIAWYDKLKP